MDGGQWFTFHLPAPPSVNRFKKNLGNKSPIVQNWINQADKHLLLHSSPYPRITTQFEVSITWHENYFGVWDIDNRVKPLLDWMQRVELISNDKFCRRLVVEWGDAPIGCVVKLVWED